MNDFWLGIEVFSIIGGICGVGIIVISILEKITLSSKRVNRNVEKQ